MIKRNESKPHLSAFRLAYSTRARGSLVARTEAWQGLGGGAVYELLVGLREEDMAKS